MPGVSPPHQPREATDVPRTPVGPRNAPPVCPTDDEAHVPRKASKDKRSLAYAWRSGVAGGMAGCAVCELPSPLNPPACSTPGLLTLVGRPKRLSRRSIE